MRSRYLFRTLFMSKVEDVYLFRLFMVSRNVIGYATKTSHLWLVLYFIRFFFGLLLESTELI